VRSVDEHRVWHCGNGHRGVIDGWAFNSGPRLRLINCSSYCWIPRRRSVNSVRRTVTHTNGPPGWAPTGERSACSFVKVYISSLDCPFDDHLTREGVGGVELREGREWMKTRLNGDVGLRGLGVNVHGLNWALDCYASSHMGSNVKRLVPDCITVCECVRA